MTAHFSHIQERLNQLYDNVEYVGCHTLYMGKDAGKPKNPIWRVSDNTLIMFCEPETLCIMCDEAYNQIIRVEASALVGRKLTFYRGNNGYIMTRLPSHKMLYIHQIIMSHYGQGRGIAGTSVDHIDRNPLNNTIHNLRIVTMETQIHNSHGVIHGTKRKRQITAQPLPDGIKQDMLRKYVVYYNRIYNKEKGYTREYFTVEHPALQTPWESSKSGKVSIYDKLNAANKVADDLTNGIFPSKPEKDVPKYFRVIRNNEESYLVFDRKTNEQRYNMQTKIKTDSNIETEIIQMKATLIQKYGECVFQ